MKISVIVPVYNVEKFLPRCIDSILAQTFNDYQLILVDDGSPDGCPEICDEYAKKYDFIHVIHKKNGGVASARNSGIGYALKSGSEWITFVDSDDFIHPQYLELLYSATFGSNGERYKLSCAGYSYVRTSEKPNFINNGVKIITPQEYWCFTQSNAAIVWSKLFHRELFHGFSFPEGVLFEDEFATHKLLFATEKMAMLDANIYFYYINESSAMHSKWSLKKLDAFDAYKEQCEYFLKNGFIDAFRCSNRAYVWMIYFMFCEQCVVPKHYKKYKKIVLKGWKKNFNVWRKSDELKKVKKYRWYFTFFYPIKVGIIDNIKDALKQGGLKTVISNVKAYKARKRLLKNNSK